MQKSVTLSSAEAEYFGAMLAAKDTIFIRDILVDLGLLKPGPTIIFADSKSAVDMAFDPVAFKNTKHILRAAEFLRDLVAREVVTLEHLRGEIMVWPTFSRSRSLAPPSSSLWRCSNLTRHRPAPWRLRDACLCMFNVASPPVVWPGGAITPPRMA